MTTKGEGNEDQVQLVVVGSCMRDLTSLCTRLPKPGETVTGHSFVAGYGGKGANQCLAAARLGAKTAMVAKLGKESHGESYIAKFIAHGVNVDHVTMTDATHTGIASIFVDDQGQNCIVIVNGANEYLSQDDVTGADHILKNAAVVICQLESNVQSTLFALKLAKSHGVRTIMNAAPVRKDFPTEIISLSDVFCVNETEAEAIVGHCVQTVEDAGKASKELLGKGCGVAIVTLGEKGAVFAEDSQAYTHICAKPVKALDTTGAGDAFVGALGYFLALHKQMPLSVAVQRACHIASVSVQYPGTHVSYPWRKDLPPSFFE